jgi:TonB family protein
MRAMRNLLVATVMVLGNALTVLSAQHPARADDTAQTSLESGTRARPLKRPLPNYPQRESQRGVEGWVVVSYVIKPDGTVGETIIEDSSGRRTFERETLRAVQRWRYEPATMNGEAIEQCHTKVLISFALDQPGNKARGATSRFKKQYKDTIESLNQGKFEKARSTIDEMEEKFVTNLYERSRLWLLRSMLQEKEGDDLGQLESLQRGVSGGGPYVEPKVYLTVLMKIFNLQMQFQHYADALDTIEALEDLDLDNDMATKLAQFKHQIEGLRTTDQAVAIEGTIGEAREEHDGSGVWEHQLLRRTAGIEGVSGSLERVELRCDWRRVKAKPEKGRAWRIPPEWGECSIYVFGEPGSTFQLLEYASTPS